MDDRVIKQSGDPVASTDLGIIMMGARGGYTGTEYVPIPLTADGLAIAVAAVIGGSPNVNIANYGGVATSLGQKTKADSIPVTFASDTDSLPVNFVSNSTLRAGTNTIVATGVGQQVVSTSTPIDSVTVQNDSGNVNSIFIGNSAGQFVELSPSDSATLEIDDINKVYIKGTIGDVYNYFGS